MNLLAIQKKKAGLTLGFPRDKSSYRYKLNIKSNNYIGLICYNSYTSVINAFQSNHSKVVI